MWAGWVRAPGRRLGSPQPQLATGGLSLPLGESASLRSRDQRQRRPRAMTHRLFVTASWPETLVAEPTTRAVPRAGVGGRGVQDLHRSSPSPAHGSPTLAAPSETLGNACLPYRSAHKLVCTVPCITLGAGPDR